MSTQSKTEIIDFKQRITVPVVLLAFNKPEKTKQVFDVIKDVKPSKLYVAVDAPRPDRPDDVNLCRQVREIVKEVGWDCEANYLFHENNLGCSRSGKAIWDWVFKYEEEIIFLEDDGIPSRSFFWFAQNLLKRYRHDTRIMAVYGVNYGVNFGDATYFFTKSGSGTYVKAFWKRTYDLYEYNLDSYYETINTKEFIQSFPYKLAYKCRKKDFKHYLAHGGETYDIQSIYMCSKYNMYSIVPNINMGTDIGWDMDATNNVGDPNSKAAKKYGNRLRYEITDITHPDGFQVDSKFEKQYYRFRYWDNKNWLQIFLRYYLYIPMGRFLRRFPLLCKLYKRIRDAHWGTA